MDLSSPNQPLFWGWGKGGGCAIVAHPCLGVRSLSTTAPPSPFLRQPKTVTKKMAMPSPIFVPGCMNQFIWAILARANTSVLPTTCRKFDALAACTLSGIRYTCTETQKDIHSCVDLPPPPFPPGRGVLLLTHVGVRRYFCPHAKTNYPRWEPPAETAGYCQAVSDEVLAAGPFPPNTKLFFYGNSHLRQVRFLIITGEIHNISGQNLALRIFMGVYR